ncbi:MAG: hypothetical protein ACTTH7_09920 [Treponema sp.]
MKKNLFAIAVFAFLLFGCPNNIAVNTSQNQTPQNGGGSGGTGGTTPSVDDPNAKTILTLQNNSSVSLDNIKYAGKETEHLVPGASWIAKSVDKLQGYIYFDVLGTQVHTNEPIIIQKDKKLTHNITDNTLVIGVGGKPGTMPLLQLYQQLNGGSNPPPHSPQQAELEGGVFLIYQHNDTAYYQYFSNGIVYEVEYTRAGWKKYSRGGRYQGQTLQLPNGTSIQLTVTADGIRLPNGGTNRRISDPAIINTIKNLPVSPLQQHPSSPQGTQSLEGKICVPGDTPENPGVKILLYFLNGTVHGIQRQNGVLTRFSTGMTYHGTVLRAESGATEQLTITDGGLIKPDGSFWSFLSDSSEIAEAIKALF